MTQIFGKMQAHIRTVTQPQPGEQVSPLEATARQNVQHALAMKLQDLSLKFRRIQKSYLERTLLTYCCVAAAADASGFVGKRRMSIGGCERKNDVVDGLSKFISVDWCVWI